MIQLKLDKSKKYLLACSFGPDSMALFHLLYQEGYKFDCAIVNYHLREESDYEVKSLKDYASKFNIMVHVLDVKENLATNIEARCRTIRYQFFKDLTDQFGYDATLVAHHQDDLLETFLMQKQRQNCPIFYGIKENTTINGVNIIRPLLTFTKAELLKLCEVNNVPYSVDKTNFDVSIKRNKIRHQIIAKMTNEEREILLQEINIKNNELQSILCSIDLTYLNDVEYVLSLDEKSQQYALNMLVKKLDDSIYLSKVNVGQVISILKSNKPNGQFTIKNGLYLIKEYESFEFFNNQIKQIEYSYVLNNPSKLDTPYFYLDFTQDASNRNVTPDDYPLTIRNVQLDDFVIINGYKCHVKRLLIDWKVPYRKRLIWPAIFNKDNVCIYIPRYQKDFVPNKNCNFFVK